MPHEQTRQEVQAMASHMQPRPEENQENDLLDMMFGTGIAFAFFMGIALIAGIISYYVKG
jgi:hypothetical protein